MIAVIADDFTGAAEIGGIALRLGWNTIIDTRVSKDNDTDILIIATNTRSKSPEEARLIIRELTQQLLDLNIKIIYKKIDSVLRGNVGEELLEQLAVSGKKRALLIPANPSLRRVIKDGIYYYEGLPLKESTFSNNAKHKVKSSNVIDLMGEFSAKSTEIISKGESMPGKGLIVGNTMDEADLEYWAAQMDEQTLMAGGSGFFNALLRRIEMKHQNDSAADFTFGKKALYVCGSAFPLSRRVVDDAHKGGQYVAHMPSSMFSKSADREAKLLEWEEDIIRGIHSAAVVIIAIDQLENPEMDNLSVEISKAVASVVSNVMERIQIEELLIEGGATAAAIIDKLVYKKFHPTQELAPGVIRMKVEENKRLHLTMKPGSYTWPSSIWKFA